MANAGSIRAWQNEGFVVLKQLIYFTMTQVLQE